MNTIRQALEAYQSGDLRRALLLLLGGPQADDTAAGLAARTEAQAAAGWPAQGAVADLVALAIQRIRWELGEDVVANVPATRALRTALEILGDEERLDAGLQGGAG
jgi:hypothetical protein